MSISVQCPGCEKKLKAKDDLAGKRVKCPSCGHGIVVPASRLVSQSTTASLLPRDPPAANEDVQVLAPSPSPKTNRIRWPWYAGGGVAALCLGAGLLLIFALPDKPRMPSGTQTVAGRKPDPRQPDDSGNSKEVGNHETSLLEKSAADRARLKKKAEAVFAEGKDYFIWPDGAGPFKRDGQILYVPFKYFGRPNAPVYRLAFSMIVNGDRKDTFIMPTDGSRTQKEEGKDVFLRVDFNRTLSGKGTATLYLVRESNDDRISNEMTVAVEFTD